jgi:hypothetical protein
MEETEWISTLDKQQLISQVTKQGLGLVSFESSNQTESLILAQDERWRRA